MDIDDNNNNNNNDEKNNSITSSSKYVNKKIHSILLRNGCFVLLNLSSSSFGPQGSFKVMKANQIAESVIVSSISSEIFSLSNLIVSINLFLYSYFLLFRRSSYPYSQGLVIYF